MEVDRPVGASDPQSGLEERAKVRRRYFAQYPQATVSTKSPDFSLKTALYAANLHDPDFRLVGRPGETILLVVIKLEGSGRLRYGSGGR
jgi:hypothetical protein